ncbi:MAG: UMP kinase [Patescibacteria group bacterium]|jgi:uridylate kinase
MNHKIIVLSLGGSLIIPQTGFNTDFLIGFRELIVKKIKDGYRFIIVCGGGSTARSYQRAALAISHLMPEDIDWIGIHATRLNAHFIRTIFREYAHPVVARDFNEKLPWVEPVLVVSGWKPGCSTDFDAVKFAELYESDTLINLSNISHIYDSDPKMNPKAKRLDRVTWSQMREIVGDIWVPGANAPFDPVACKEGQKMHLKVLFAMGTDLAEVEKAIEGKAITGTIIE